MNHKRLQALLKKYSSNGISANELSEMYSIINENNEGINDYLSKWLQTELTETKPQENYDKKLWANIIDNIIVDTEKYKTQLVVDEKLGNKPTKSIILKRCAAAAAILFILCCGIYYINYTNKAVQIFSPIVADVPAPKQNKATIQLHDGKTVLLDEANQGTLAIQGKINIVKNTEGEIIYVGNDEAVTYNTLTNPKGSSTVSITLQDGSKVWLNNESTITYPTAFIGNERKVSITGEAYFEVAKNASKKFIVNTGKTQVNVLGTHFNVNNYPDEQGMKITLLEGAVQVVNNNANCLLKPGQQATVASAITVAPVTNMDEVMAWKNGFFHFESADLKTILKQFARYYDIEVVYEGIPSDKKLFAIISKKSSLMEVLNTLQASGVHFKMMGNKLFIQSK